MSDKKVDIAVIGGGASGLAAAITAKRLCGESKSVLVLERLPKCGKKILATGNGRCNLMHVAPTSASYHGSVSIDRINASQGDVEDFFAKLGLLIVSDGEGRLYPFSNTATSVLDALRLDAEGLGVSFITDFEVTAIVKKEDCFIIKSNAQEITAKRVILSAGGCASPAQGSNGSGFAIAEALGIELAQPLPALCPLITDKKLLKPLSGLRVRCSATLLENGAPIRTEKGEVQFTNDYISGICIFNLSTQMKSGKSYRVSLNLLDGYSASDVKAVIKSAAETRKNFPLEELLTGIFNKKLALHILKLSLNKPLSALAETLSENEITAVCKTVTALDFPIRSLADFSVAQVTAGGVTASEITGNLESRKHRGLYFAGEILDIHGDCGGYNLYHAWLSGICAGSAAASSLQTQRN